MVDGYAITAVPTSATGDSELVDFNDVPHDEAG